MSSVSFSGRGAVRVDADVRVANPSVELAPARPSASTPSESAQPLVPPPTRAPKGQAPVPSIVADAVRYALSEQQCSAVVSAIHGLAGWIPWVTTNLVHHEKDRPGLFQETMGSSIVPARTFQFTIDAPLDARAEKQKLITHAQHTFDTAQLKLRVSDAGDALLFGHSDVDKSLALATFARTLGISEDSVAKFGDKAGETGNDKHLRGRFSYNVGKDQAFRPEVDDRVRGQHALGTVAVVRELLAVNDAARVAGAEPPVRAFMFDFDGTLTMPGHHGIHPQALDLLLELLARGEKFAVCTGRGPALFPLVLTQLLARGASTEQLERCMTIYMFNGARPLLADELPEVVRTL